MGEKRFCVLEDLVADGLVTLYLEAHAGNLLDQMTQVPYSSSPHFTLTRSLRHQLSDHHHVSKVSHNVSIEIRNAIIHVFLNLN